MANETQPPVPDPTILTTEQLERAIENLKGLMEARLEGLEDVFSERFNSVDNQFQLIEGQRVEQKKDTKDAVDAALAAAKEAVGKSEVSTKEQLNAMRGEMLTALRAVTDAAGDVKDRVIAMESLKQGATENRSGFYAAIGVAVSFLFLAIGVVGLVVGLSGP